VKDGPVAAATARPLQRGSIKGWKNPRQSEQYL
jgi:hypothetical protein